MDFILFKHFDGDVCENEFLKLVVNFNQWSRMFIKIQRLIFFFFFPIYYTNGMSCLMLNPTLDRLIVVIVENSDNNKNIG